MDVDVTTSAADVTQTPADEPLEKASEAAEDAPDVQATLEVAPELAKAAEGDAAPDVAEPENPAPETVEPAEVMTKSAAGDVVSAHIVIEGITSLIAREAGEGDQVASLRTALEAMQAFSAAEAAEVGTDEDAATVAAELPVPVVVVGEIPMYYAAVTGDLAKRALELRKSSGAPQPAADLDSLITLALAAGGRCGHEELEKVSASAAAPDPETLAKVADAALERASEQLLSKVTQAIGAVARPDDLEAVKAEVLGALAPMKEELAKIASQPAPGGPVRFATDPRRFGDSGAFGPSVEAEVLSKAAQSATDPAVKEALGVQAAAASIRAQQGA